MAAASYEVIVVGAGSMGMSAGFELARRGRRVLLLDAHDPPHTEGSHHGDTRLLRHAYHGGEAYIRFALRADARWRELERLSGETLLVRSGVLNIADPAVYDFRQRLEAVQACGVEVEIMDGAAINRRWPGFAVPPRYIGMYEPAAGYLFSERGIAVCRRLAEQAGAALRIHTTVDRLEPEADHIAVWAGAERFTAKKVILSAGSRFGAWQALTGAPVQAVRKVVGWFEAGGATAAAYAAGALPGFTLASEAGVYYGFPDLAGSGVKIGRHDGGERLRPGETPASFGALPSDEADLRQALERYLPGAAGRLLRGGVCKYEMTADEHFILDEHPAHPGLLLAGGFSGHGFKFAAAVGEWLADWAEERADKQRFDLFRVARLQAPHD